MFRKIFLVSLFLAFEAHALSSFAPVVKKVMPSVVSISIASANAEDDESVQNDLTFSDIERGFIGSGVIVSADGYILTNRHVIEKAKEISVTTSEGKVYDAALIGQDDVLDVALVKIDDAESLAYAVFADSNLLETGDFILAIGNPFGLKNTVTTGIVSALGRDMKETPFDDYIQTDAPINQGNSGGPMFNVNGEVVGLNTLIYSKHGNSLGVGFAIPANQLKPIYEALKENGAVVRSTIGADVKETVFEDKQALIVTTLQNEKLCEKNDLKVGDIILSVDSEPFNTQKAFQEKIAWTKPETELEIAIWRDGEIYEKTVSVEPVAQNTLPPIKNKAFQPQQGIHYEKIGLTLQNFKVVGVDKNSEAEQKGVKVGDEIKGLNGHSLPSEADLALYINESATEQKLLHFNLQDLSGHPYFVELMPK